MREIGWLRVVVVALSGAALVGAVGCSSGGSTPSSGGDRAASSGTSETVGSDLYAGDPVTDLDCRESIGVNGPDEPNGAETIAGVVALPTGRELAYPANTNGFAKFGLVVRPGAAFDVIVPTQDRPHVKVQWGAPGVPTQHLRVPGCEVTMSTSPERDAMVNATTPSGAEPWVAFSGGVIVDQPRCVSLIIRTADQTEAADLGVGVPCPDQGSMGTSPQP